MDEGPVVQHHAVRKAQLGREPYRHVPAQGREHCSTATAGARIAEAFDLPLEAREGAAQRGGSLGWALGGHGALELRQPVVDVDRRSARLGSGVHEDRQHADGIRVVEQRQEA